MRSQRCEGPAIEPADGPGLSSRVLAPVGTVDSYSESVLMSPSGAFLLKMRVVARDAPPGPLRAGKCLRSRAVGTVQDGLSTSSISTYLRVTVALGSFSSLTLRYRRYGW